MWKKVLENFEMKTLGYYHDLYVQSNRLLLADLFESFPSKCVLASVLKNVELELLTDTDMLLIGEKGIRGGTCHAINWYAEANNKYMKSYNKDNESSYIMHWDANNLHGWVMSQKLSVDGLKWKKNTSKFNGILSNENFIKNYNEESDIGCIIKIDVEFLKRLHSLHNDLPFVPERMKIK